MMTLYSGITCPFSQRCRFVLYEKGMDFEIKDVDVFNKPEDLALMNPYNQVPVLVERDLILHESNIINEYIDERFPHPQLMPGDPVMRGRGRLVLYRMEKELFSLVQVLENPESTNKEQAKAREAIGNGLTLLAPSFAKNKYILGDDFSMIDVALSPLLWRLDYYDIKLGKSAAPLLKYAERIFQREAFIEALTPAEKSYAPLKDGSMATSTKPYLLRALYEWCLDNNQTPHIVAWVNEHTRVPMQYVRDNEIVLNIGPTASHNLNIDNEWVNFSARFSGVAHEIWIPVGHIVSIFGRESGEGMGFEVEPYQPASIEAAVAEDKKAESTEEKPKKVLKLVK